MISITDTIGIRDDELDERFVRASGPGGQNVNKVATAVELRFNVFRSTLPDHVKLRVMLLAGTKLADDGTVIIQSRAHRTQGQNREAARDRLADLVRRALTPPKPRRPSKPPRTSRQARLDTKKRRGDVKSLRRRPDRE